MKKPSAYTTERTRRRSCAADHHQRLISGVFQGVTTTDATIEHSGTTFAYVFKHGGHIVRVTTTEEDVKKNLGMTPEPTYAVTLREAIVGKTLLQALKTLKGSKTLTSAAGRARISGRAYNHPMRTARGHHRAASGVAGRPWARDLCFRDDLGEPDGQRDVISVIEK